MLKTIVYDSTFISFQEMYMYDVVRFLVNVYC